MSQVSRKWSHTERRSHTDRVVRRWWAGAAALAVVAGCAADRRADVPAALATLTAGPHALGTDTFEVWVCRVPADVADPLYLEGGDRLALAAGDIARRLEADVPAYFAALSGDRYRPAFVAGGEVTTTATDGHQGCIDRALDASGEAADAVLVVADAEHDGREPGGLAQAGSGCACPARTSRRMVYVGASDFHPDWGPVPALDLIEHEIGHTLGLPHSGDARSRPGDGERTYTSGLDVMSNSAAPREIDPTRRHGPATIAANLLALGWMDPDASVIVPPAGGELDLVASNLGPGAGIPGPIAGVVVLDDARLLTVELLAATGYDDHLPASGVAVHLVDQSPGACGRAAGTCRGVNRRQVVMASSAPHTDLLTAGEEVTAEDWTVRVVAVATDGRTASVALVPA